MKNLACLSLLLLLSPACGGGTGTGDTGTGDLDAPGSELDAPATEDSGTDLDGGATEDGGSTEIDGGSALDGGSADASTTQDTSCIAPRCAPIPPGCYYEGATPCECGTLVCPSDACDPACSDTEFCNLCGASPTCAPAPTGTGRICPDIYMPVCGCDGMTYSNSCSAAAAGMAVQYDGECGAPEPEPTTCVPDCRPGTTCQACRGPGGAVFVCIPEGAVC